MGGVRKEPEKEKSVSQTDVHLHTHAHTRLYLQIRTRCNHACVTQVVGHGDEAEARDVGVVPGLVQLLLGCVVTGEAFGCSWSSTEEKRRW